MNIPLPLASLVSGSQVKRQSFSVGSFIALLVFGIIFGGAGFAALSSTKVDSDWLKVTGEITGTQEVRSSGSSNGTTYAPVVHYEVASKSYSITSSLSSSVRPTEGASKEVAYNPSNPNDAKVVDSLGSLWFLYIFPVVGLIIILIGCVSFIKSLRRSTTISSLKQTGQKIQGVVVELCSPTVNNNKQSFQIVVAATAPNGIVQNYTSDSLSGFAGLSMVDFQANPIPADVYIDPLDPQNYYVDVENLPNITPDRISQLIQFATKQGGDISVADKNAAPKL